jgi:geranylgeranyl pyrophosphate synthase
VQATLPLHLDAASATPIVGAPHRQDRLEGIDLDHLSRSLVEPIRTIVDRAGKAWRSYVALACCDAVGGDSQPLLEWLALPELMHVGSLMVDDVQDRSRVRRGGPAAHTIYGEPLTINAGTLCYFLPQIFLNRTDLPAAHKLRIYELYFEAARAAHAGQALDLAGFAYAMPDIVERGDGTAAEARVRAIHRLKSAAPAGCLARVGALVGNGTETQIEALGSFIERVGLAFQIVDDALNLSGFERDLKSRGEDLTDGKVTMPVAKAMGVLDEHDRRWLWDVLTSRPSDPTIVGEAIDLIDRCGALRACHHEAEQLIEDAWRQLDPLLPESQAKLMLRAFSWFVLARHY